MNHLRTVALVVLAGLIVLPAGPSFGQATKYLDEQGNPHWVQGPGWVPEQYRATATQPTLPKLRSGDVIGNERIPEGPTVAEQQAARMREHNANVQRLILERAPQGGTYSDFAAPLQERHRQLGVLAEDAAQRRADDSFRHQQQPVDFQRGVVHRLQRTDALDKLDREGKLYRYRWDRSP